MVMILTMLPTTTIIMSTVVVIIIIINNNSTNSIATNIAAVDMIRFRTIIRASTRLRLLVGVCLAAELSCFVGTRVQESLIV